MTTSSTPISNLCLTNCFPWPKYDCIPTSASLRRLTGMTSPFWSWIDKCNIETTSNRSVCLKRMPIFLVEWLMWPGGVHCRQVSAIDQIDSKFVIHSKKQLKNWSNCNGQAQSCAPKCCNMLMFPWSTTTSANYGIVNVASTLKYMTKWCALDMSLEVVMRVR